MILSDGTVRKFRRSMEVSGHAHELTFSCYQQRAFLSRQRTREWMVDALRLARDKHRFELWAYVIMPEHVHVLLLPCNQDYKMPLILKSIKQSIARRAIGYLRQNNPEQLETLEVTRNSGRTEFRFWQQGGGYDRNIMKAETAWKSVEYIHNNPVRRGLSDCPTNWPWSSARWYAGMDDQVLEMDGCPPTELVR